MLYIAANRPSARHHHIKPHANSKPSPELPFSCLKYDICMALIDERVAGQLPLFPVLLRLDRSRESCALALAFRARGFSSFMEEVAKVRLSLCECLLLVVAPCYPSYSSFTHSLDPSISQSVDRSLSISWPLTLVGGYFALGPNL